MAGEIKLAVGAIVKNEYPYLLEWIAFHKLQGVSRFYIADNDSSDCTTELLKSLDAIGEVKLLPFDSIGKTPGQLRAYSTILEKYNHEFDWVAFIDADEFILPEDEGVKFSEFLKTVPNDVGAVALNWAIYGSSGHKSFSDNLTVERFSGRAEKDFHLNNHFKSVVSRAASPAAPDNPHRFRLPDGLKFVHTNLELVKDHHKHGIKVSNDVVWDAFRLNHYNIRSSDEFFERKATRGLADSNRIRDNEKFFHERDRNEVQDPISAQLLRQVGHEVGVLISKLKEIGYHYSSCGTPSPKTFTQSVIDHFKVGDGLLSLVGSSFYLSDGQPVKNIKVFVKGVEAKTQLLRKPTHPSLVSKVARGASCGFDIVASVIGRPAIASDVEVRFYDEAFERFDSLRVASIDIVGFVDNVVLAGALVEVHGWFFIEADEMISDDLRFEIGSRRVDVSKIERVDRLDVSSKYSGAPDRCGFIVYVPRDMFDESLKDFDVYVSASHTTKILKKTTGLLRKLDEIDNR